MRIRILETAIRDLENGIRFYERQEEGVGFYFRDCLLSDIDSLGICAGVHAMKFGFHRLLSKRFPYAVYYLVHDDTAEVFRVLDCRRDPEFHRRSLGEDPPP